MKLIRNYKFDGFGGLRIIPDNNKKNWCIISELGDIFGYKKSGAVAGLLDLDKCVEINPHSKLSLKSKNFSEDLFDKINQHKYTCRMLLVPCEQIPYAILKTRMLSKNKKNLLSKLFKEANIIDEGLLYPSSSEPNFIDELIEFLKPLNLSLITQNFVLNCKYRLDGFIPELSLNIEFDEPYHRRTLEKVELDKYRDEEISSKLNYKVVRVTSDKPNSYNLGIIAREILLIENPPKCYI